ncbi:hypothetical protein Tco_0657348 [Tanacetum coccineum]|uniref:Uncharacterized protein n=1 Tax=Tanacetum coccineum TaxID=301880 RepID=A0ABQ4XBI9_9ASTR
MWICFCDHERRTVKGSYMGFADFLQVRYGQQNIDDTTREQSDAKTMFAAIETRIGGNEATKKTQKTLLKQQYENFSASSTESLDSIFNRSLKITMLNLMNKADIEIMSIDDLYNNFKIVKQDVKKSVGASSGAQNLAFMSAPSTSKQIHEDDLEAMDLKWQLSLLSRDVSNVTRRGTLAREKKKFCRAPRNKEGQFKYQDNTRKQGNNEDTSSKAMLAIDGVGFDWSDMAEEQEGCGQIGYSSSTCYTSNVNMDVWRGERVTVIEWKRSSTVVVGARGHGMMVVGAWSIYLGSVIEVVTSWGLHVFKDRGLVSTSESVTGSSKYGEVDNWRFEERDFSHRSEMNRGGVEVGCDIGLNIDGGLRLRWMRGGLLDGYSDYGRAQFKIEVYNWSCQFWEICGSKVGQWLGVGRGQNYGLVGCRGGGGLMSTTKLNMWVAAIDVIQIFLQKVLMLEAFSTWSQVLECLILNV